MTKDQLIDAIRAIRARLDAAPSEADKEAGWTDVRFEQLSRYFEKLETDLLAGAQIPFFSLIRGLDGMGIGEGQLLEEMCRINNAVNALNR
jgi:hypothetical protein